jgi:hypothetical protein
MRYRRLSLQAAKHGGRYKKKGRAGNRTLLVNSKIVLLIDCS